MNAKLLLGLLSAFSCAASAAQAQGFWSKGGEAALRAVEGGAARPLGELLDAVHGQIGGSIMDTNFAYRDGKYVYDLTVLDGGGVVRDVSYDAGSFQRIEAGSFQRIETQILPPPPGYAAASPPAGDRRVIRLSPDGGGEEQLPPDAFGFGFVDAGGEASSSFGGEAAASQPSSQPTSTRAGRPGLSVSAEEPTGFGFSAAEPAAPGDAAGASSQEAASGEGGGAAAAAGSGGSAEGGSGGEARGGSGGGAEGSSGEASTGAP